jgi:hypothetical protein
LERTCWKREKCPQKYQLSERTHLGRPLKVMGRFCLVISIIGHLGIILEKRMIVIVLVPVSTAWLKLCLPVTFEMFRILDRSEITASIFREGWRWRQYAPPKHWYRPINPYGVSTQKTNIDIQWDMFYDTYPFACAMICLIKFIFSFNVKQEL